MHFVQADKLGISERHLPFTTFTECPTDSVPLFYSILQFLKPHISKSIKYSKAIGSGNPPSLIPALWNIGILLHKQATQTKHFDGECTYVP